MTVATGNFPELLWPGINKIFGVTYKAIEPVYKKVFNVQKSSMAFEKDQGVTGLPQAGIKEQGDEVSYANPVQGYNKEYIHIVYGLGSSVTKEMFTDDQYRYINRIPKFLAESMRYAEETVHADVINNAFTTETTADGVAIISSSHINAATGSTQANRPTTYSDLSQTALEQAFIDIAGFKDDQDQIRVVKPKKLLVPRALMFTAEKILGTRAEYASADNTINPMYKALDLLVWDYITDTDSWFVLTDQTDAGLTSFTRWDTEFDRDNEFDTKNLKFTVTRRWSQGCTDWRNIYGSTGA